ncbi:hypothetical protein AVEN_73520-1 [Araneus ventricosus]|uniref:Uncharacterized protein n=1 Tax=Araneus ventricosus TaxID=182803 RepID=A0A4Y2LYM3_ARAVE|nr:hypothetical protein AVEN_125145-1 [Araneus ventricosus]GBN19881.1 hypothetical protein AVEN_73520-1 [Araneus ventricosus]
MTLFVSQNTVSTTFPAECDTLNFLVTGELGGFHFIEVDLISGVNLCTHASSPMMILKRNDLPDTSPTVQRDENHLVRDPGCKEDVKMSLWQTFSNVYHTYFVTCSHIKCFSSLRTDSFLSGRHFRTDAEVQEDVVKCLRELDPDFFYSGLDKLVHRWSRFFNNHDDYVEK